ncbi:MAG: DPP IV N-terminal domain-containing protein [Candidatus Marinimicrobia bacterium]|nr:DPP IV N-terminal domain-containing protein [Candidatus Neomarinimicrobiota bacterium]
MKKILLLLILLFCILYPREKIDLDFIFGHPRVWGVPAKEIKWSPDDSKIAFLWNDSGERYREIWIAEIPSGKLRKLTKFKKYLKDKEKNCNIRNLRWFPDGKKLLFAFQGDIYTLVDGNTPVPLTATKYVESNPKVSPDRKYISFVRNHNIHLIDVKEDREIQLTHNDSEKKRIGEGYYKSCLDADKTYQWSNNSKWVAFIQYDFSNNEKNISSAKIGITNVEEPYSDPVWLKAPEVCQSFIREIKWSPDDKLLAFETITNDLKERYIILSDTKSGDPDTLYREYNKKWVSDFGNNLFWIANGKKLLFGSGKNGYNHLYTISIENRHDIALTRGKWNVIDYKVDDYGKHIFFTSTKDNPNEHNIYSIINAENKIRKISYKEGVYDFYPSHNGKKMAEIYSSPLSPPELFWSKAIPKSKMNKITDSVSSEFGDYSIIEPLFKTAQNKFNGKSVSYRVWFPEYNLATTKYPIIAYVHGGHSSQSNLYKWDVSSLLNQWLSEQGFVVIDLDYSSITSRNGGDNHNLWNLELSEIISVIDDISKNDFVDASRAGIWGWGYGGYLATMAMFKEPGVFNAGVAITSMTNWNKHKTWHQDQIIGLLVKDTHIYTTISPEKYYKNLGGNLLFIQGAKSSTAPLLNTSDLIKEMITNGQSVDFIFYPWESDCIELDGSYIDLFQKVYEYFKRHLHGKNNCLQN